MIYHRIEFTSGRSGDGYMEIEPTTMTVVRILDDDGEVIEELGSVEYHITDTDPPHLGWMEV